MKNKTGIKSIPKFNSEAQERAFWAKVDALDYFDLENPTQLDLSQLKPSTKSISLRLPEFLLDSIKQIAHSKDIPYQSLMKMYLAEKTKQEFERNLQKAQFVQ